MQLIRDNTFIPTPRVHRTHQGLFGTVVIVTDFINGSRLDRAWPELTLWSKLRVAWTLSRTCAKFPVYKALDKGFLGHRGLGQEYAGLISSLTV